MKLKKELPYLLIIAIPFIYLAYIWNDLPEKVPMHWNFKGEIDRWDDKASVLIIPFVLPVLIYVLLTIIPLIDPKKKIQLMGNKYNNLKFAMTLFMSVLALFILYSVKNQSIGNPNLILLSIGLLYTILGNYMKTIKANYFIGIRTPWTLESENVWKKTHLLTGKLWFAGGFIIIISSLLIDKALNATIFMSITFIIVIIPFIYSYLIYKKTEKTTN